MSNPGLPSPLRRALPLVTILLLTACDAPQLLPPDTRLPDGSTYSGDIRDGLFHGEGSYAFTGESEDLGSLTGIWEFGEFVDQEEYVAEAPVPEEPALLTETILVEDRQRLNNQIESLAPEQAGVADAYFLAVGGDGTESVFMRDIQVAKTGLQA